MTTQQQQIRQDRAKYRNNKRIIATLGSASEHLQEAVRLLLADGAVNDASKLSVPLRTINTLLSFRMGQESPSASGQGKAQPSQERPSRTMPVARKGLKPSNDGNLGTRESDGKLDRRTISKRHAK